MYQSQSETKGLLSEDTIEIELQEYSQQPQIKRQLPPPMPKRQQAPVIPPQPSPAPALNRPAQSPNFGVSNRGIPFSLVACCFCTVQQLVEGSAPMFACSVCQNLNKVRPTYGLFKCGRCNVVSCYKFGVTQVVKCVTCMCSNKVPLAPPP